MRDEMDIHFKVWFQFNKQASMNTYNVWTDTLRTINEIKNPLQKNTKYKLTKTVKKRSLK